MRLDEGWNQIQFNLADFTRRAYGTNYVETVRVQIHANCRIRRIYFSDRLYSEEELPPEYKLYLPAAKDTAALSASKQKKVRAPVVQQDAAEAVSNPVGAVPDGVPAPEEAVPAPVAAEVPVA
jgi:hypothetical protein